MADTFISRNTAVFFPIRFSINYAYNVLNLNKKAAHSQAAFSGNKKLYLFPLLSVFPFSNLI